MGLGDFAQRHVVDPFLWLEGKAVAGLRDRERESREAGVARNELMLGNPNMIDQSVDVIRGMMEKGVHQPGQGPQNLLELSQMEKNLAATGRLTGAPSKRRSKSSDAIENELGARRRLAEVMPRGPVGNQRSIGEIAYGTLADNALARRSFFGGSAVLGGVGMTAGAQQLMALMQYLQAGQTTEAEAGQPLTS